MIDKEFDRKRSDILAAPKTELNAAWIAAEQSLAARVLEAVKRSGLTIIHCRRCQQKAYMPDGSRLCASCANIWNYYDQPAPRRSKAK